MKNSPITSSIKIKKESACKNCLRPLELCICGKVTCFLSPIKILILQHPQEQYKLLNSAKLCNLVISNSVLKVGFSWPNLKEALGENVNIKEWGVLFLKGIIEPTRKIELWDCRKKCLLPINTKISGIVVLDGSWKQAKTLWWRNPWLLKLIRITLNPDHLSIRLQAKKHALSTAEAIAMALECLGHSSNFSNILLNQYYDFIIKPNMKI
jgi:DTW domain-containing protein YfiP